MLTKICPEEIFKDIIQKYENIKDESINDYIYVEDIKGTKENVTIDLYKLIYSINCLINIIKKKEKESKNIEDVDDEYKNKIKYLELEIENNIHNNNKIKDHIKNIEESYKKDKNDKNKIIQKLSYKIEELEIQNRKEKSDKLENEKIIKTNILNDKFKDIDNIFIDAIYKIYIMDKVNFIENIDSFYNVHNEINKEINENIHNVYNESKNNFIL